MSLLPPKPCHGVHFPAGLAWLQLSSRVHRGITTSATSQEQTFSHSELLATHANLIKHSAMVRAC